MATLETILWLVTGLLVVLAALLSGYHVLLGLASRCGRERLPDVDDSSTRRFAIVIPAHNEQAVIRKTLRSCLALDYPQEAFQIVVIADNCEDGTAQISREMGVECLERHDTSRCGKGHALSWAFGQLLDRSFDACLVLDADCVLDNDALRVVNGDLSAGHQAIQLNNVCANPDVSAVTYVLGVANYLENDWFYRPKTMLGLSVMLRGTGMVLTKDLLGEQPWEAHSIAEDLEYSLDLIRNGGAVLFEHRAGVYSDFPADLASMQVQRTRWVGGGSEVFRSRGLALMWAGLARLDLAKWDAGWTTLVCQRSRALLILACGLLAACLSWAYFRSPIATVFVLVSGVSILGYAGYLLAGLVAFGISKRRWRLMRGVTAVVWQYLWTSCRAEFDLSPAPKWIKTPREESLKRG